MSRLLTPILVAVLAVPACNKTDQQTPKPTPSAAPSTPTAASVTVPTLIAAAVASPDRSDDDRKLDAGRHPAETLAFFGIKPGMKVAELAAGGGYTAELLARVVGPTGTVYGQNSSFILERFAQKPWTDRLAKPVMQKVVRLDRSFDDPLPSDVKNLDAVFMVLFYHDMVWQKIDRAKMNKVVFDALKPGGVFAIIDHSGRPGTGSTETETLHRIEEKVVREELLAAGFQLEAEASFLRNPSDTRDWNDSPRVAEDRRGKSDRFVLKFVRPR